MSSLERVVVTNWMLQGGGSAGPVIMMCYYAGQEVFEEFMDRERWSTYKQDLEWEQLPIYTLEYKKDTLPDKDDKIVLTNSTPTLKRIGDMFNLYGNNVDPMTKYKIDVWIELCSHCLKTLYPSLLLKGKEKEEEILNITSEGGRLYKWFERFNRKLGKMYEEFDTEESTDEVNTEESNKKLMFLVNNKISIADFNFYSTINTVTCGRYKGIDEKLLLDFYNVERWKNDFLTHYKKVLDSNPKKEEYPFILHNGRYYVNGKDQTDYWANKTNHYTEDERKNLSFKYPDGTWRDSSGKEIESINIKMTKERYNNLSENIKQEVKEEILTRESTLKEVENASVKVLKHTLDKHNTPYNNINEKSELVSMVKDVLTQPEAL